MPTRSPDCKPDNKVEMAPGRKKQSGFKNSRNGAEDACNPMLQAAAKPTLVGLRIT
jgi:hypothetical protein